MTQKLETLAFLRILNPDSQKEVVKKLLPKIFLLFDINEACNSQDLSYEMDYMFHGAFISYEQAYKNFLETILIDFLPGKYTEYTEENAHIVAEEQKKVEELNQIYDNFENISQEKLSELLVAENWKIVETEIFF